MAINTDNFIKGLQDSPPSEECLAVLAECGCADRGKSAGTLADIVFKRYIPPERVSGFLSLLLMDLSQSIDPDTALNNLERFVSASASIDHLFSLFSAKPSLLSLLVMVFGTSQYLSDCFVRNPEFFDWLVTPGVLVESRGKEAVIAEIQTITARYSDEQKKLTWVRRIKEREFVRIAVKDLLGLCDLQTTIKELSSLADAVMDAVCRICYQRLEGRYGIPLADTGRPCRYAVIALGKLGGHELNYYSDIDIIALYDEEGCTEKNVFASEFYTKLTNAVSTILNGTGMHDTLYKVDLRLRPEGVNGPLVRSMDSYENYYAAYGGAWERFALAKARFCAGDRDLGMEFLSTMAPFIYKKALSYDDLAGMVRIKERIEQEHKTNEKLNVKLSRGGIRDIEFVIQFYQILLGGKKETLREQGTVKTLQIIKDMGLLGKDICEDLEESYVLLRRVEHFLQIEFGRQSHTIPDDTFTKHKLARSLGFAGEEALLKDISARMERVYAVFEKTLHTDKLTERTQALYARIESFVEDGSMMEKLFKDIVFTDPDKAGRIIRRLYAPSYVMGSHETVRKFQEFCPVLIELLQRSPNPDASLLNFERFVSAYGSYGLFYEMLTAKKYLADYLVNIGAYSQFLSDMLCSAPSLFELMFEQGGSWDTLQAGGVMSEKALESFVQEAIFVAGSRFVTDQTDQTSLAEELGSIIDTVVEAALSLAAAGTHERYPGLIKAPYTISCLGSAGSLELTFGSDVDLLFYYDDPVDEHPHAYTYLFTRTLQVLNKVFRNGYYFKVDTRLRPNGDQGTLVNTVDILKSYYTQKNNLWEKMVLLRLRNCFGDDGVFELFRDFVRRHISSGPASDNDLDDLAVLRRKMIQEKSTHGAFDLKFSYGALTDLEFFCELFLLRILNEVSAGPPIPMDTNAALSFIEKSGCITRKEREELSRINRFYRTVLTWLRIYGNSSTTVITGECRQRLQTAYEQKMGITASLEDDLAGCAAAVTKIIANYPDIYRMPEGAV